MTITPLSINRLIFTGSAAESVVESANSTTRSVTVCQLALLNMFNILSPFESADENQLLELADAILAWWVRALKIINLRDTIDDGV